MPARIRSLFISDLHLGFRLANASACFNFLRTVETEYLFLVGDTIDGWRLAQKWYWPESHAQVLDQIEQMRQQGCHVLLVPGNHDDFLRDESFINSGNKPRYEKIHAEIGPQLFGLDRREFYVHETRAGQRLYVTHGDLFDDVEQRSKGISVLGSRIFDRFSHVLPNRWCHGIRHFFKSVMARPDTIKSRIVSQAIQQGCGGAIYGHIHKPLFESADDLIVINTGDWVENQSYLIEHLDGRLELINFGQTLPVATPSHSTLASRT